MRIEKINENKIKIEIDAFDVKEWNVDLRNFSNNTPEVQNMLWHALRRAERDVNFCIGKSQLMVETLPSTGDGFVMVVSKLENEAQIAEVLERTGKKIRQVEFKIKKKQKPTTLLRIFKFSDFESLCDGVREIYELYMGESRLVKYQGDFFLELLPHDALGIFEMENILSEFSERMESPIVVQGVLNEHGLVMMNENAVSLIAENFTK